MVHQLPTIFTLYCNNGGWYGRQQLANRRRSRLNCVTGRDLQRVQQWEINEC